MERISIGAFRKGNTIICRADIDRDKIRSFVESKAVYFDSPAIGEGNLFYDGKNLFLHEWEKYKVRSIDGSFLPSDFFKIGEYGSESYGTLLFKNCVGIAHFRDINCIIVESSKITEEGMLHLTELVNSYIANLSYDYNQPTASQIFRKRQSRTDLDYHVFLLIHNAMRTSNYSANILVNWKLITGNPCRNLDVIERYEELSLVNDITDRAVTDILAGATDLVECKNPKNRLAKLLSRGKKQYVPKELYVEEIIDSFDNPENRLIKFFFLFCKNCIESFQQHFMAEPYFINRNLIDENKEDISKLNAILNTSFLKNVGDLQTIPKYSTVLTRRDGYRQIFNLFLGIRSIPTADHLSDSLHEQLENKALDVLYENYCYFATADILASIYGERLDKKKYKVYKNSFSKTLKKRTNSNYFEFHRTDSLPWLRLHYNKNYTEESYSKSFDPDISLEILNDRGVITDIYVFDAKFKMKISEGDEDSGEDTRTFQEDDISKMHTYRDALRTARGAFVLYPGDEKRIFYADKSDCEKRLSGVGAFPFRPSNDGDMLALKETIRNLLHSL